MAKWYERADALYREVLTVIRKEFRKCRLTLPFDSINSAKLTTVTTTLYRKLVRVNKKYYCDLCDYLWEIAWREATTALTQSRGYSDTEVRKFAVDLKRGEEYLLGIKENRDRVEVADSGSKTVKVTVGVSVSGVQSPISTRSGTRSGTESPKSQLYRDTKVTDAEVTKAKKLLEEPIKEHPVGKFDSEKFVNAQLVRPNPVTGYAYDTEADRKRERLFESGISHVDTKNRREFENDFKRAENLWDRQTEQGFIDTEDAVRKKAYEDAGTRYVRWNTEQDERVCADCSAMEGMIFPIDRVPSKPHPRCRCWVTPVR